MATGMQQYFHHNK